MQAGKYAVVHGVCIDQEILDFLASYCDEFLVHGVDVEGKK